MPQALLELLTWGWGCRDKGLGMAGVLASTAGESLQPWGRMPSSGRRSGRLAVGVSWLEADCCLPILSCLPQIAESQSHTATSAGELGVPTLP